MSGILVASALTTTAAVAIGRAALSRAVRDPGDRAFVAWLVVASLPLEPASFFLFRLPVVDVWLVRPLLAPHPVAYGFAQMLYAPLTEEPFKLLPWLVPALLRRLRPENAAAAAGAVGLGFGVGEIWTLAALLSGSPVAALPWWQLGGFLGERLAVCVCHGGFTAAVVWCLARQRSAWPGFAVAAVAHFLANAPIAVAAIDPLGFGRVVWTVLLQLWLVACVFASVGALAWVHTGQFTPALLLLGRARCPRCATVYDRSFLALNLGPRRYERCPACRTWNLTTGLS